MLFPISHDQNDTLTVCSYQASLAKLLSVRLRTNHLRVVVGSSPVAAF